MKRDIIGKLRENALTTLKKHPVAFYEVTKRTVSHNVYFELKFYVLSSVGINKVCSSYPGTSN